MLDLFGRKSFWLSLGLAAMVPFAAVYGQDDDDDDDDEGAASEQAEAVENYDWPAEREQIIAKIASEVDARARANVKHIDIVNEYGRTAQNYERPLQEYIYRLRLEHYERNKKFLHDRLKKKKSKEGVQDYPLSKDSLKPGLPPQWTWASSDAANKPKVDITALREQLSAELDRAFLAMYPEPKDARLRKEASKKYRLYTKKDIDEHVKVEFKLRQGKGTNTTVTGILFEVAPERMKVGSRYIYREDMDEETQAMFYPEVNETFIKDYVDNEKQKYTAVREEFVRDWVDLILPERLMANLFVPQKYLERNAKGNFDITLRLSTNTSKWTTRFEKVTEEYGRRLERKKKELQPVVEKEFFENAQEKGYRENYEKVQTTDANGETITEWVPASEAERRRQAAAQAPQEGEGMGPDGMPPMPPMPPNQPPRP